MTQLGDERDCLIDAAYHCLSHPEKGPASIAAMLAHAGVSARAFYRYFASKDELFLAMLQQENDALVARLDAIADHPSGSPADQLQAWVAEVFDLIENPVRQVRSAALVTDDVRAARGYRECRNQGDVARQRSLADILRRGQQDGSFPLAKPAADAVSIDAVCTHAMSGQIARDQGRPGFGKTHVVDFAMRSLGVH